jgi:Protein of unknown function (DUF2844)
MKNFNSRLCAGLLFAFTAAMQPALAELGGDASTIEADRVRAMAKSRILPGQNYTMQEIQIPNGTTIREYLSPNGKVFAVTWNGPFMPDLKQLLGSNYTTYLQAAQEKHARHGPLMINRPGLVARSGGHMRAFSGFAYIPQLVPANVSISELK